MDKIRRLQKEKENLKKEIEELKERITNLEKVSQSKNKEIADSYKAWFDNKRNTEFVLYEKYPSMNALTYYSSRYGRFPLYDYGRLNVKELAEIIRHLYQFITNQEFNILTIGSIEDLDRVTPHVRFVIGNNKTLASYQQFNGTFSYDPFLDYKLSSEREEQSLISIDLENLGGYDKTSKAVDLECLTQDQDSFNIANYDPFDRDKKGYINYIDETQYLYKRKFTKMGLEKQIFSSEVVRTSIYINRQKFINNVLDFAVHPNDTFITKVLISIIIYKRNNGIEELTEEDYNHIFDVLFKEKVTIKKDAEEDFPRTLKYVPKEK